MANVGPGDSVRIIDGPYHGFRGTVVNSDHQNERVEVRVAIYGRPTVLRLGPFQVERL
jgi:transcriptional antiterminator NusG